MKNIILKKMRQLKQIQRECLTGKLSIPETIERIGEIIGGITRVDFKDGKKFKISNHREVFPLDYNVRKRYTNRLYSMAVGAYFKARENGSLYPGEVHISREASTKHHMDGIYAIGGYS